ncbi:MAG TPA: hypothetical protein PKK26_03945 [Candidatus Wallbacteria bacterium]|nr:hypothetical protein [Candidatus Wallbacteria bacterium]
MKISMSEKSKKGITIVELLIYGGIIFFIGFGAYQAMVFFQEWQCRKNMTTLNEAVEIFQSQGGTKLTGLDQLKTTLKTSSRIIPKCPSMPVKYNYFFNPSETRVRCAYHGTL